MMDVEFQRTLIDFSLRAADQEPSGFLKDFFLSQASRLDAALQTFLKEHPECTVAITVRSYRSRAKAKSKPSWRLGRVSMRTRSAAAKSSRRSGAKGRR